MQGKRTLKIIRKENNLKDFNPDYSKCEKSQKQVFHSICDKIRKSTFMFCGDSQIKCIAWEGYKHED